MISKRKLLILSISLISSSCDPEKMKKKASSFGSKLGLSSKEEKMIKQGDINAFAGDVGKPITDPCLTAGLAQSSLVRADLNKIIEKAHLSDPSCNNIKVSWLDEETQILREGSIKPELRYKKVMAHSFLNRICAGSDNEVLSLLKRKPGGRDDSLSQSHLRFGMSGDSEMENIVGTYAIMYTLGQKEASGQFLKGKDPKASNNLAHNKEAGVFQYSADSLGAGTKEGQRIKRKMFKNYLGKLSKLQPEDMVRFCGVNLLNMNENKKIKKWFGGASKIESNGIYYDTSGKELSSRFKSYCSPHLKRSFSTVSATTVGVCFQEMQKFCPNFTMDYATVMTRTHRLHNGPLYTKDEWREMLKKAKSKRFRDRITKEILPAPQMKPACHGLFRDIYKNKSALCQN